MTPPTEVARLSQQLSDHEKEDRLALLGTHDRISDVRKDVGGLKKFMWVLMGVGLCAGFVLSAVSYAAKVSIDSAVGKGVSAVSSDVKVIRANITSMVKAMEARAIVTDRERAANSARIEKIENRRRH